MAALPARGPGRSAATRTGPCPDSCTDATIFSARLPPTTSSLAGRHRWWNVAVLPPTPEQRIARHPRELPHGHVPVPTGPLLRPTTAVRPAGVGRPPDR